MAVISSRFKTKKTAGMPSVKGASGIETLASHVENPNAHPEYVKKGSLPEAVNVSQHVADVLAHCAGYARRAELLTSMAEYEIAKTRNLAEDANNYAATEGVKRHIVTAYMLNQVLADLVARGFGDYIPTSKIVTSTGPEPTSDFDTYVPSWRKFKDLRQAVADLPESLKDIYATKAYVDARVGKVFPDYSCEFIDITSGYETEDNGWIIWKSIGNVGEAWIMVDGVKVVSITHYRTASDIIPVAAGDIVTFRNMQNVWYCRTKGKVSLRNASVTLDRTTYDCTGKTAPYTYNCCPTPTVQIGDTVLVAGTDYTVSYLNNTDTINYGTEKTISAICVITGIGTYYGSINKSFTINLEVKASVTGATIVLNPSSFDVGGTVPKTYTCEPAASVSVAGHTLVLGTDYSVTYEDNTGTVSSPLTETRYGTAKIIGMGQYTGTRLVQFEIRINVVAEIIDINRCTIDLVKTRYDIDETVPVSYSCHPGANVSFQGETLVEGVDYTMTYSDNASGTMSTIGNRTVDAVATIYGINRFKSSTEKSFDIYITATKKLSDLTITKSPLEFDVTGEPPKPYTCQPQVVVKDGTTTLTKDTHYEVEYSSNSAGTIATPTVSELTGSMTIRGKKSAGYTGEETTQYPIRVNVTADISSAEVTLDHYLYELSGVIPVDYNCKPAPTVVFGGQILTKDTHYSVSWSTNSQGQWLTPGTSTITCSCTITGIGLCSGTVTKEYQIRMTASEP